MALTATFQIAPGQSLGSVEIRHGYEGSSQSFKAGELLVNSSGTLVVATADPTAETIVGLSVAPATGTTNADCLYIPIWPHTVLRGQIQNAAGDATLAIATHMYAEFGLNVTSNVWWIDTDETTHKDVLIINFVDAVGTLNGFVDFQIKPGATVFAQAVT